nr:nucleotide-binding alpha-beta plait domain-containing protein [Tanacetum cinerariifolium]
QSDVGVVQDESSSVVVVGSDESDVAIKANIAQFQRNTSFVDKSVLNNGVNTTRNKVNPTPKVSLKTNMNVRGDSSYVGIVKNELISNANNLLSDVVLVIGEECLNDKNFALSLFGRVKEFASMANLKVAIGNEGFEEISIKYMGEQWVLLEFQSVETLNKFKSNVSIASWFSYIINASNEFEVDGRIAWVKVEGVPLKLWGKSYWIWANETVGWVPDFTDEDEDEEVNDTYSSDGSDIQRQDVNRNEPNSETSIKFPPGFTPPVDKEEVMFEDTWANPKSGASELKVCKENINDDTSCNQVNMNFKDEEKGSLNSGHFKKSGCPRTDRSILGVLEEVVKVGQVMGYNMDGCLAQKTKKDWVRELCIRNKVNFLALQETKMNSMDDSCVRQCWGNINYDHALSDAVVYAPQDSRDKIILWDFLQHEISKWKGESIIMGDFNEGVLVDGVWVDEPKDVKKEFFDHFNKRFGKPGNSRAKICMKFPNRLSSDQILDLELEVSKDEVNRAVWECGTDKAPRPDGFTFRFFRQFWYLVEKDVFDAVSYFFSYVDIPRGCNSSFIALIPKIPNANDVKDFRPISLIDRF